MRRRDVITLLGGAAAWPLAAGAQQSDRVRRIVVVTGGPERDPDVQAWYAVFLQGLEQLGWRDGRNVRIERRSATIPERQYAAELVALAPDIILASGTSAGPLLQLIHDVPIVFVNQ
jgi:hypothetical protein